LINCIFTKAELPLNIKGQALWLIDISTFITKYNLRHSNHMNNSGCYGMGHTVHMMHTDYGYPFLIHGIYLQGTVAVWGRNVRLLILSSKLLILC